MFNFCFKVLSVHTSRILDESLFCRSYFCDVPILESIDARQGTLEDGFSFDSRMDGQFRLSNGPAGIGVYGFQLQAQESTDEVSEQDDQTPDLSPQSVAGLFSRTRTGGYSDALVIKLCKRKGSASTLKNFVTKF